MILQEAPAAVPCQQCHPAWPSFSTEAAYMVHPWGIRGTPQLLLISAHRVLESGTVQVGELGGHKLQGSAELLPLHPVPKSVTH